VCSTCARVTRPCSVPRSAVDVEALHARVAGYDGMLRPCSAIQRRARPIDPVPNSALAALSSMRLRQHCNGYTTGTGHQARPLGGFSVHPEACPSLYGKIAFEFFLFSWCRRLIRCPPDRSLPHCVGKPLPTVHSSAEAFASMHVRPRRLHTEIAISRRCARDRSRFKES
jgi:hypothetical protein